MSKDMKRAAAVKVFKNRFQADAEDLKWLGFEGEEPSMEYVKEAVLFILAEAYLDMIDEV